MNEKRGWIERIPLDKWLRETHAIDGAAPREERVLILDDATRHNEKGEFNASLSTIRSV